MLKRRALADAFGVAGEVHAAAFGRRTRRFATARNCLAEAPAPVVHAGETALAGAAVSRHARALRQARRRAGRVDDLARGASLHRGARGWIERAAVVHRKTEVGAGVDRSCVDQHVQLADAVLALGAARP